MGVMVNAGLIEGIITIGIFAMILLIAVGFVAVTKSTR